jgi:tRNA (cytidine/uridine-2'-O-)-methyltransferase
VIKGHPHICLYRPEIPQNTGTTGRLVAATQSRLHIIRPCGFSLDDRNLKRAGLDYWPYLDLEIHDSFNEFTKSLPPKKMAFFSKKAVKPYWKMPSDINTLVFGQETKGLPQEFHEKYSDQFYSIPIYHPNVRSLNLASAVSIVTYYLLNKNSAGRAHEDYSQKPTKQLD